MDPGVASLIDDLRRSEFRDLAGTRITARLPVARPLVNRLVADALKNTTAPIREVDVRPIGDDRFEIILTLRWPFVPAIPITVTVDRQPVFPDTPVLVLRWALPGGLEAIASQFVGSIKSLPAGVKLEGERVLVDVHAIVSRSAAAEILPYLTRLQLHATTDRLVIDVELRVEDATRA
jgi:hypothetical protein